MMRTGSMRRFALPCSMAAGLMATTAFAGGPADVNIPAKRLADTAPGTTSGMSTAATIVGAGGKAFFRASTSTGVYKMWRSSGRAGGTYAIAGTEGIASDPILIPGTQTVLFYTGTGTLRPLMAMDAKAQSVQTISPGAMWVVAQTVLVPGTSTPSQGFAFAGSRALFLAPIGGANTLWTTDGTGAGTGPVVDPAMGTVGNVTPAGQNVYFTTRSAAGVYTLWQTDGTVLNPTRVANLRSAPTWSVDSSGMRAIGDRVLFSQTVVGSSAMSEVWTSDGTQPGTHAVAQTPSQSTVLAFPGDGVGLFSTRLGITTTEFWRMSSTASECVNLMNFARATTFVPFGNFGSMTLFGDKGGGSQYNTNQLNAVTIWITDGTAQNTLGIPGFPGAPGGAQTTTPSVMVGDTLYLDSGIGGGGHEPWRVNLSTGSISVLRDILPGGASSNPTKFFALDHNAGAGFLAFDTPSHSALFTSDGTPAGTRIASRLAGVSSPYSPKSVGSRVFLVGNGTGGFEPYAIDLCPGDYDNSGSMTADDLFGFLNDWFLGAPDADVDDVRGAPDANDLMSFFNAWMTPCGQ